jgi:hypothetical protein
MRTSSAPGTPRSTSSAAPFSVDGCCRDHFDGVQSISPEPRRPRWAASSRRRSTACRWRSSRRRLRSGHGRGPRARRAAGWTGCPRIDHSQPDDRIESIEVKVHVHALHALSQAVERRLDVVLRDPSCQRTTCMALRSSRRASSAADRLRTPTAPRAREQLAVSTAPAHTSSPQLPTTTASVMPDQKPVADDLGVLSHHARRSTPPPASIPDARQDARGNIAGTREHPPVAAHARRSPAPARRHTSTDAPPKGGADTRREAKRTRRRPAPRSAPLDRRPRHGTGRITCHRRHLDDRLADAVRFAALARSPTLTPEVLGRVVMR